MKASYKCSHCDGQGYKNWFPSDGGPVEKDECPCCVGEGMPPTVEVEVDPIFGLASAQVSTKSKIRGVAKRY